MENNNGILIPNSSAESTLTHWDAYPDYTSSLPKLNFETEKPFEVLTAGEITLSFVATKEATLKDLQDYLDTLEALGYDNHADFESADNFGGKIYKNGTVVLEYTYKYGTIIIDVFKTNKDLNTGNESKEETTHEE